MSAENIVANIVTCRTNGVGYNLLPGVWLDAPLHVQLAYIDDDLDSGSTIKIARLPKGAMIVAFGLTYEALGAAVTAQIGDSGDADRYVLAGGITSMVAAGSQLVFPRTGDYSFTTAGVVTDGTVGWGYRMADWTDIILTTGGADFDGTEHRIDFATIYACATP